MGHTLTELQQNRECSIFILPKVLSCTELYSISYCLFLYKVRAVWLCKQRAQISDWLTHIRIPDSRENEAFVESASEVAAAYE